MIQNNNGNQNIFVLKNIKEVKIQKKEDKPNRYSFSKINNVNNIQKKNEINIFSGKERNNEINTLRINESQNICHLINKCKNRKFILVNEFLKNSKIKMEIMKIKQKFIYLVSNVKERL